MAEPSWYVLDVALEAPNDAHSQQLRATSLESLQARLASLDPEEFLCDVGLWVVRERRVVELIDLRRFVALGEGERELRWSERDAFIERFEAAAERGEVVAPRFEWAEFVHDAPTLEPPLLADDEDDAVLNPKAIEQFSARRGLNASWRPLRRAGG